VLAIVVVATLALTGCGEKLPTQVPPSSGQPSPVKPRAVGTYETTGRGPDLPERGVWMGAWVKADWQTPSGRAAALDAFARQTGTDLPIAHMFHAWPDEFPGPTQQSFKAKGKLQLISWSGTDTRSITSGVYDAIIRQRAEQIRSFGLPLLLRWRWEMDRPNLAASIHSPGDYVAAWKHIRAIFTEVGATNAAFVWCPHVLGFVEPERDAASYYPGDDQVDWLCTDVYPGKNFDGFASQMDAFMAFARQHPRPVMLGEFGVTTQGRSGQRAAWLREARQYIKTHPQIKAAVYFAQKQDKPAYDSTFNDDPQGLAAFREMTADPYFAAGLPPLLHPSPGAVATTPDR
jgi:hypothetical protein